MGEAADNALSYFMRGLCSRRERPRSWQKGSGKFRWRTGAGRVVNMDEMTDQHLSACIEKCRREGNSGKLAELEQVKHGRSHIA